MGSVKAGKVLDQLSSGHSYSPSLGNNKPNTSVLMSSHLRSIDMFRFSPPFMNYTKSFSDVLCLPAPVFQLGQQSWSLAAVDSDPHLNLSPWHHLAQTSRATWMEFLNLPSRNTRLPGVSSSTVRVPRAPLNTPWLSSGLCLS